MLFSILIPVYNVENYLRQCLDSILTQSVIDYEVILVNDGSTDNSEAICMEYASKDKRFRCYSKTNEGLLLTRRYSLKYAQGDYILFLDSDDYWESNLLAVLKNEIDMDGSYDMILFRYKRVRDNGAMIYEDKGVFKDRSVFTDENRDDFLKEFVSSSRLNTMWSKCVKREVVDIHADYSSFQDKKGEDLLQSMSLIQNSKKILYLDKVLYNYRLSTTGRGRNFKPKYLYDLDVVRYYVYEKLKAMKASSDALDIFYRRYLNRTFVFMEHTLAMCENMTDFKNVLHRVKHFKMYNAIIEDKSFDINTDSDGRKIYKILNGKTVIAYYTIVKIKGCIHVFINGTKQRILKYRERQSLSVEL